MSILIRGGLVLAEADAQPVSSDILVDGDRIAQVGAGLTPSPDTQIIEARERLAIPGFVNAHTHTHNVPSRGALDGWPFEIWSQYRQARQLHLTPREMYVCAAVNAIEMAKTGTTCACDMVQVLPYPTDEALDAVCQAYADVGLRASLATHIADGSLFHSLPELERLLPRELLDELAAKPPFPRDETLATIRRTVERWHGAAGGRIRFGPGPSSVNSCSDEFLEGCVQLAAERDLTIQIHLVETKASAQAAYGRYGKSATVKMHELGLLGPRTLLPHAIWIDDRDIDLLAETGSTVAHNPMSNMKLGDGIAPVLKMVARGCNVALGTDGSASSDNQNMFGSIRMAAILHRVVDPNYERWLKATDVLRMATANGARGAGFEDEIGSITPGKKADLVLLDLRSPTFHPRNNLPSQLVHCETGSSVNTVLVDGRVILEDGRMATVDEEALLAEVDEVARRVNVISDSPASVVRRLEPYIRKAWSAATRADWPVNQFASEAYRDLPEAPNA